VPPTNFTLNVTIPIATPALVGWLHWLVVCWLARWLIGWLKLLSSSWYTSVMVSA